MLWNKSAVWMLKKRCEVWVAVMLPTQPSGSYRAWLSGGFKSPALFRSDL